MDSPPLPRAGRLISVSSGASYLIFSAPVTIGRDPLATITLEGDDVSRSHAYVLRTPQGYILVDSSLHGTYVNGDRIQAQRVLAHGDLVEVGGYGFRFETWQGEVEPAAASAAELPKTSQHLSRPPSSVSPTGKVGLAIALEETVRPGSRIKEWIRRYGVSEVAGISMALGVSWLVRTATESAIAGAYAASIGEALGFYGSLVARQMLQDAYAAGTRRAPYRLREMADTWRGLVIEFGPAELLDTGLIRPLAMGLCGRFLGFGLGIVAGKLVADVAFYLPVIYTYERRKRRKLKEPAGPA